MNKSKKFADVYIGYPIEGSYTYSIPADMDIMTGIRVKVDFRNRIVTAFVHRIHDIRPDIKMIKNIEKKIDEFPIFDSRLISLAEYTASNYICNTGEVMATALPSGEKSSSRYKHPFKDHIIKSREIQLNDEQKAVYNDIVNAYNNNLLFHLIFGITGSGKTEIYIELARYIINQGRSVIYLVPEITLSSQIFQRLYNVFKDDLIVYHSRLTANQRLMNWIKFYNGDAKIAIGTRSAVFLQCPDPGLIIIDEEHDWSYKEHSTPRYHARRLAYFRSKTDRSLLVMGSATPSIETLYSCEHGPFKLHNLKCRFGNVEIHPSKRNSMISPKLLLHTKKALDRKHQAIFLLNRRGFSPVVLCNTCGNVLECPNCNISLNLHKEKSHNDKLVCHYCGYSRNQPSKCPECGSNEIIRLGAGTQKIEDDIKTDFEGSVIFRLDQDSTRKKDAIFEVIKKMSSGDIDILLGTQMVAKGFDFSKVSVVGILLADIGLNMPDFRASERIFSLLIQASGRCGRGNERGKVILQTINDENYIYKYLKNHDYLGFYKNELSVREMLQYPPFSRMARLLIRGRNEEKVIKAVNNLKEYLYSEIKKNNYKISLLGPVAAPLAKISNNFRHHIILKSRYIEQIRNTINSVSKHYGNGLYLEIDIDPYDIL
jgi:primosomal protein N' (replication factor Y) (superfamily II helicase)